MIYIIVQDNIIINRVVCDDPVFASEQGWEPDNNYGIGWVRNGDTFQAPEPEAE